MTNNQKDKLRKYMCNLPEEHHQHLKDGCANHIRINKDGVEKYINISELTIYLENGWKQGISKTHKDNISTKIRCIETGEIFDSIKLAQLKYPGHINEVIRGTRKTARGYHWELVNKDQVLKKRSCRHTKTSFTPRNTKRVRCIETGIVYNSLSAAVNETGFVKIGEVCRGNRSTAGGYHWEYIDIECIKD